MKTPKTLAHEIARYALANWGTPDEVKKQYEYKGKEFTLKTSHSEAKLVRQATGKPQQVYNFGYHQVDGGELNGVALMGIENFIENLAK